ncbi:MAG: DUF4988 domain-containing protein [Bacteroidales bacterium]|jgi:hypothetical protein|nr:DUF4988 domain-containing protein [Bacteroidales bacterium]MCI2121154.1 DUF4988 domain-containing protein [Bacteroidales bacterium]MCI2144743.1 DUF4988 domain-containing protein [Bacteroidales bacterium]
MKRFCKLLAIVLLPILATSCYGDLYDEVDDLGTRVDSVKQKLITMKSQVSTLSTVLSAYNAYYYVTDFTPVITSGDTTAYKITFSNGKSITVTMGEDGEDAIDGETPVIGVRMYTDGYYYWTVTYGTITTYIYDSTYKKVRAGAINGTDGSDGENGDKGDTGATGESGSDGTTPLLKISAGDWYISFDDGASWTCLGQATGDAGATFFHEVTEDENGYVVFTMTNGTVLKFPSEDMWKAVVNSVQNLNASIALAKQSVENLESSDYVTSIKKEIDDGDTVTTVSFKKGNAITIRNGKDGNDAPAFYYGVRKGEDDKYYWTQTVDGVTSLIYDTDGNAICVTPEDGEDGTAPIVSVKVDTVTGYYYWAVSIDGADPEFILDSEGDKIMSTGLNGDSWIASVSEDGSGDFAVFTLSGGDTVTFPTWAFHLRTAAAVDSVNSRVAQLKTILDEVAKDSVQIVSTKYDYDQLKISKMTITFSDGTVAVISEGKTYSEDTVKAPVISVGEFEGRYYWTIKYAGETSFNFILDGDGNKILAIGNDGEDVTEVPVVSTLTSGGVEYWAIQYGSASYFITDKDGNRIPVEGMKGDDSDDFNLIESITSDDTFTYITIAGGTTFKFLTYKDFSVHLGDYSDTFVPGASVSFAITIEGTRTTPQVEFISYVFGVTLDTLVEDPETKVWTATLSVSSSETASGDVLLFVTDGFDKLITKNVHFVCQ